MTLSFHHVGVVTPDLAACASVYAGLGYQVSRVILDPVQQVQIVLCTRSGEPMIELITPSAPESPASGWLKRMKAGPYHTCYQVDRIEDAQAALGELGFTPLADPVPAVAFEGRRVLFLWSATTGLMELLERGKAL